MSSLEDKFKMINEKWGKFAGATDKDLDKLVGPVNNRKEETDELFAKMDLMMSRFSVLEDRIRILEEESVEKAARIKSLSSKVKHLQGKMCHCNKPKSRPLSGSGTREDPHELEYASEEEYLPPPVAIVTTLIPIDQGVPLISGRALHFGDDEESVVPDSQESSPEVAVLDENEEAIPIPFRDPSTPICHPSPVRSGQHCIRSGGVPHKHSFAPYHKPATFMGQPFDLPSTVALR